MGDPNNILLGEGVFSINGVDIGLVRGGGAFSLAREYRQIEADGDYGPVKGRIRKVKSVPTLKVNALELLPTNLTKLYPAMSVTSVSAKDTLAAAADILTSDYNTVSFTGITKAGKPVYIEVSNAINLEKIEWGLKDKDEVVAEVTYTGTYLESSRTTEPWKVEFSSSVSGDIVPPSLIVAAPKAGTTTMIVIKFNENLHSDTLAITDRNNLLSSLTNDGVAIAITSQANSVTWVNPLSSSPEAIITIASTTFVNGKTVRANVKINAVKDLASNVTSPATNFDAVVS